MIQEVAILRNNKFEEGLIELAANKVLTEGWRLIETYYEIKS